jgi:DNA invertase Pin-like site-specific DNA recombinase
VSASERTKAALQAAKARGIKLGNPNGAAHLQGDVKARAVATLKAKAQSAADGLKATIEPIMSEGVTMDGAQRAQRDVAALIARGCSAPTASKAGEDLSDSSALSICSRTY